MPAAVNLIGRRAQQVNKQGEASHGHGHGHGIFVSLKGGYGAKSGSLVLAGDLNKITDSDRDQV